jgi:hypothetical protein
LSRSGWSTVSGEARNSRSCECLDGPIRRDDAHAIGSGVGDVEVSHGVDGHSFGLAQCS